MDRLPPRPAILKFRIHQFKWDFFDKVAIWSNGLAIEANMRMDMKRLLSAVLTVPLTAPGLLRANAGDLYRSTTECRLHDIRAIP
jgi:hypothetical protein